MRLNFVALGQGWRQVWSVRVRRKNTKFLALRMTNSADDKSKKVRVNLLTVHSCGHCGFSWWVPIKKQKNKQVDRFNSITIFV